MFRFIWVQDVSQSGDHSNFLLVNAEVAYSLKMTEDNPERIKVRKQELWKKVSEKFTISWKSSFVTVYLFFNKVLKSNSPESSFPSVLLQKHQPPAAKHQHQYNTGFLQKTHVNSQAQFVFNKSTFVGFLQMVFISM